MRKLATLAGLVLSLVFSSVPGWSYEEVRINKVVPLVGKNVSPSVLRTDKDGHHWILNDEDGSIQQVSSEGRVAFFLNAGKKKSALFRKAADFNFMPDGTMIVADAGSGRIVFIGSPDKNQPINWKKPQILHQFPFDQPTALAVSREGIICVGGKGNLFVLASDGTLLHQLFAPEKNGIQHVTRMAYSKDGMLWVLDGNRGALHRFSRDRKWQGATEGLESAKGVAVDEFGYAYVTVERGRWKEISRNGVVLGTFGTKGRNPGEMIDPTGIVIEKGLWLWVAEAGNRRFQLFQVISRDKHELLRNQPAAYITLKKGTTWNSHPVLSSVIDVKDRILNLNAKKNVLEWVDLTGRPISTWKKKDKNETGLVSPVAVTRDMLGRFWVTDEGDHSIKQVDEDGKILKTIGGKGKKEGSLKSPSMAAIRQDGSIAVVDRGNSRVQVLNTQGVFQFALNAKDKEKGNFFNATSIAVNADRIAVLDNEKKSLLFFDANGKFISEVANKEGRAPVWKNLAEVAADSSGRFYVLDQGSNRVRMFSPSGQFLADFSAVANHMFVGPKNRVLLAGDKESTLYEVVHVPRAIQDFSVRDADGDVRVSWEQLYEASHYNLYRSSDDVNFNLLASTTSTAWIDASVTPGVYYQYNVTGVNAAGVEGDWTDPKSIKAAKRKNVSLVTINEFNFEPVFAAAAKYYVKNPIGSVEIQNHNDASYRDVKLSITLKRYTDYATEVVIDSLAAGEKKIVPVTMTFNDRVLELTENTPVQAELRVSYFEDNFEKSASRNAPLNIYSRNAISWVDKARVSSFITPRDAPIMEFTRSAIRPFMAELKGATIGRPLAKAILFYEGLNALGISYAVDPKTPFADVSGKPDVLDYVQFPRETLRRKTGDCDDTTALLASLLENVGVEVALVDTPGHIFLMANLEDSDPVHLGLPVDRFVEYRGSFWVPIETTKLGKNFMDAWQAGIAEVKSAQAKNKIEFISVREAGASYPPVTLVEEERDKVLFPVEKVRDSFTTVLEQLQKEKYEFQVRNIKDWIEKNPDDRMLKIQLGMVHVEGGKEAEADKLFTSLLTDSSTEVQAAALNNLGNMAYLKGDYKTAQEKYMEAQKISPDDGGIKVNLARAAWRAGDRNGAHRHLIEARAVLNEWREYTGDMPVELLPK